MNKPSKNCGRLLNIPHIHGLFGKSSIIDRRGFGILFFLATTALWLPTAQAYSVSAYGSIDACDQCYDVGPPAGGLILYNQVQSTGNLTQSSTQVALSIAPPHVSVNVSGTANLGALSGYATVAAADTSSFGAGGTGYVSLSWSDTFTVHGAGANGTTAYFNLGLNLADMLNQGGTYAGIYGNHAQATATVLLGGTQVLGVSDQMDNTWAHVDSAWVNGTWVQLAGPTSIVAGTYINHQSNAVSLTIGNSYNLQGTLTLQANSGATSNNVIAVVDSSAGVDASHTAIFSLDPVTAGASYTTGSGVSYVSAVPLPAGAWLFSSGLLGLIGVARRKKIA